MNESKDCLKPQDLDSFNQNDRKNEGRPLYWRLDVHLNAVEQLIMADEIQLALKLLDHVPGWYRDNYPEELNEVRKTLYRQTYDQIEYATDDEEAMCTREFGESQWTNGYMHPRAEVMAQLVGTMNKGGTIPWIFDLGCSHGNLPLGLIKNGFNFEYLGLGMNYRIQEKVRDWVGKRWQERPSPSQTTILYNTEVLEHCFNPHDVVHSAYKIGVEFDHIILSVPKYTLGGGLHNWRTRRLGHVRTWTPREFLRFADESFKGLSWKFYDSYSMVLHGVRLFEKDRRTERT